MAVNLSPPDPSSLYPVAGITLGIAEANIRKPNRKDLLVVRLDDGAGVAGVFTQNRFCAAPVAICRQHLSLLDPGASIRALVVNTGCANAGTGKDGIARTRETCTVLADLLGCAAGQILPFSTGVIMEPLPVERVVAGLPRCIENLRTDNWFDAAQAIMTTDTVPKAASRRVTIDGATVTITGIAKGAGMIHPNMATMLGFVATDAKLAAPLLKDAVRHAANRSFNSITVDGDTSTNDAFVLIATGAAAMAEIRDAGSAEYAALRDAIAEVAIGLAQAIVRDGEGATKFMTLRIESAKSEEEAREIAFAIAHSPLVKTAFFASDPNLGRILAAIGYAGVVDLDVEKIELYLGGVRVVHRGGRDPAYREEDASRIMKENEIAVRVVLNRGAARTTVWTCDLSHDYVTINAEYRT